MLLSLGLAHAADQNADEAPTPSSPTGTPTVRRSQSECDTLVQKAAMLQAELDKENNKQAQADLTFNAKYAKYLRKELDVLLAQTRLDQCRVRNAVRKINANLELYRDRVDSVHCDHPTDPQWASPELLATDLVKQNPEWLTQDWIKKNLWVLSNPVVVAHPDVLNREAVKKEPRILLNPSVSADVRLLDTAAARKDPSLLLTPGLEPPKANECRAFFDQVSSINYKLLVQSYSDWITQNGNLSNQIETRLDEFVDDSGRLTDPTKRDWFLKEYKLLADRYLNSLQFRVGFGAAYAYLPDISYAGTAAVDLSSFRTAASPGTDELVFLSDFSNRSYLSPLISVEAPYFDLDLIIPNLNETQTTITPVQFLGTDSSMMELLAQSTVVSTMHIEYDIGVRVGIGGLLERHRLKSAMKAAEGGIIDYDSERRVARFDWGLAVGLVGFRFDNAVTTDVRLRSDGISRYKDLTSAGTVTTSSASSFKVGFGSAYFKFRISDELELGVDFRKYEKYTAIAGHVAVGGDTVSISAAYYPTFFRRSNPPVTNGETATAPATPNAPSAPNASK